MWSGCCCYGPGLAAGWKREWERGYGPPPRTCWEPSWGLRSDWPTRTEYKERLEAFRKHLEDRLADIDEELKGL